MGFPLEFLATLIARRQALSLHCPQIMVVERQVGFVGSQNTVVVQYGTKQMGVVRGLFPGTCYYRTVRVHTVQHFWGGAGLAAQNPRGHFLSQAAALPLYATLLLSCSINKKSRI